MDRNGLSHEDAGRIGAAKSAITAHLRKEAREIAYYSDPKRCLTCNAVIPYAKKNSAKYCSHSCAARMNNSKYKKKASGLQHNKEKVCLLCGNTIPHRGTIFCSTACAGKYKHLMYIKQADELGEFTAGSNGEASRRLIKSYLIEKYGHKCSICGLTEWMGLPAPLIVDHIDGDVFNNKVSNFRLVCGNCDMQLPTYKSKNKKGRAWRRKYMQ